MDRPPRQQLDYYFLRSNFNPEDFENRQNIEEHSVYTPRDCRFDASLQVELHVTQDGTAKPRFIYKNGRSEADTIAVNGKPFYLDMTYSQTVVSSKAYIGLDFGTSNTSISFVDAPSVQVYERRPAEKSWQDLSDLTSTLPYPLAEPLARYLGQNDPSMLVKHALEFFESALAMASYLAYLDYCVNKRNTESRLFKGFTQRSAGPLWALLKDCFIQLGNSATFSNPYKELLTPEFFKSINESVNLFALYKHNKAKDNAVDTLRPIQIIANLSQKVFATNIFGFFEEVQKQKFAGDYQGFFRHACGRPPFIKISVYQGSSAFSEDEPFLLNMENGTAISLQPLIFWDQCGHHHDVETGHCYIYDIPEKGEGIFSFKAVGYPCTCVVSIANQYSALAEKLMGCRERDPKSSIRQVGVLKEASQERG